MNSTFDCFQSLEIGGDPPLDSSARRGQDRSSSGVMDVMEEGLTVCLSVCLLGCLPASLVIWTVRHVNVNINANAVVEYSFSPRAQIKTRVAN